MIRPSRAIAAVVVAAAAAAMWVASGATLLHAPAPSSSRAAIEVWPRSAEEIDVVLGLTEDVWSEGVVDGQPMVIVLDAAGRRALASSGLKHQTLVDDIDAVASAERARLSHRLRATDGGEWFSDYRDIQEVSDHVDAMAARRSDVVSLRRIGTSVEGWPIRSIDISRGGDIDIVLNGGQHAREWISVMVTTCVADRLLREGDERINRILDAVSFHVVPLLNPDGYVYSWNVDRYWRKNRRGGHGVDLNRNYSVGWGQRGSSGNRRSQTYRGESAFSEPESQAMRRLFEEVSVEAHLDFHSFSQLILYPWMYKRVDPPDRDKLAAIADRMSTALYATHGERYPIIAGSELSIGASGTLADWSYGVHGALSYVIELRPARGGRNGFVLPPEQIVPTCDESLAAVLELAEAMIRYADD